MIGRLEILRAGQAVFRIERFYPCVRSHPQGALDRIWEARDGKSKSGTAAREGVVPLPDEPRLDKWRGRINAAGMRDVMALSGKPGDGVLYDGVGAGEIVGNLARPDKGRRRAMISGDGCD